MGVNFVAALDAEINDLRDALGRDVRFARLRELERIRRELYGDDAAVGTAEQSASAAGKATLRPTARQASPERARIVEAAEEFVAARRSPTPTSEIYENLLAMGLTVPGANPINNLSAMLSNSGKFQPNGRLGWTLKSDEAEAPGVDDARDASQDRAMAEEAVDILG